MTEVRNLKVFFFPMVSSQLFILLVKYFRHNVPDSYICNDKNSIQQFLQALLNKLLQNTTYKNNRTWAARGAQWFSVAFSPGCDPGDPGSSPTSGSRCMEPASPSACVSASFSLWVCHEKINKIFKNKRKYFSKILEPSVSQTCVKWLISQQFLRRI